MPLFTEWSGAPGLLVLDAFSTLCCVEDLGEGFVCVDFARSVISCRKLQLSPFDSTTDALEDSSNLLLVPFKHLYVRLEHVHTLVDFA